MDFYLQEKLTLLSRLIDLVTDSHFKKLNFPNNMYEMHDLKGNKLNPSCQSSIDSFFFPFLDHRFRQIAASKKLSDKQMGAQILVCGKALTTHPLSLCIVCLLRMRPAESGAKRPRFILPMGYF